jgi:ketosteroid isomerase-like protein
MSDFIREIRILTEPIAFDVEDILASDNRAVIVGALQTRIKAIDKVITSQFAIILTITDGIATRFQMLEDSFDVSNAARPGGPSSHAPDDAAGTGKEAVA